MNEICIADRNLVVFWFRSLLRTCCWICPWATVIWASQVYTTICRIWSANRLL